MTTSSLKEEIAEQFDNCMGYWEGITVPDWDDGHRSIDYANQVLKLIEKRIDKLKTEMDDPITQENYLHNLTPLAWNNAIKAVKELLK